MRVLVMHNPTAGDEEHGPETLNGLLEGAGHDVTWRSTKDSDWERALDEPAELVVAAGGDGTVRKVFRQLAGKDVPATILPLGTANNIARSLGVDGEDPAELIQGWEEGRLRPYDIWSLESGGAETLVVESAGVGLLADLLVRAEENDSDPPDKIEQGLRLLLDSLGDSTARPWTLKLDGESFSADLLGLDVMNVSEAGPQIPLAPEADPGDGALDVVLIRRDDGEALRGYVEERLAGGSPKPPTFDVRHTTTVLVELHDSPVRVDDEVLGKSPAGEGRGTVSIRPAAQVQVLLPDGG